MSFTKANCIGKNKMNTGCPECKKMPDDRLCNGCELELLEHTARAAVQDYIDKVNQILEKKKNETDN